MDPDILPESGGVVRTEDPASEQSLANAGNRLSQLMKTVWLFGKMFLPLLVSELRDGTKPFIVLN